MPMVKSKTIIATIVAMGTLGIAGAGAGGQLYTHDQVTLRRGPNVRFVALGALPAGTEVNVLWCTASTEWCMVQRGGLQGWAPVASLKSSGLDGSGSNDRRKGATAAAGTPPAAPSADQAPASAATINAGASLGGNGVSGSASSGGASVSVRVP